MENLNKKNDQIALGLQKMVSDKLFNGRDANSFEPAKQPKKHIFEDGTIYVNDIEYGKTYPNSFLDIWYAADNGVKRPTNEFKIGIDIREFSTIIIKVSIHKG